MTREKFESLPVYPQVAIERVHYNEFGALTFIEKEKHCVKIRAVISFRGSYPTIYEINELLSILENEVTMAKENLIINEENEQLVDLRGEKLFPLIID